MSTLDIKTVYASVLAAEPRKCARGASFVLTGPDQRAERCETFEAFASRLKGITQASSVEIVNMQSLAQGAFTVVQVNGVYRGRRQEFLFFDSIQLEDTAIVRFNSTLRPASQ